MFIWYGKMKSICSICYRHISTIITLSHSTNFDVLIRFCEREIRNHLLWRRRHGNVNSRNVCTCVCFCSQKERERDKITQLPSSINYNYSLFLIFNILFAFFLENFQTSELREREKTRDVGSMLLILVNTSFWWMCNLLDRKSLTS
jgi:hypothetical protein